jgi:hypothetical protein
MRIGLVATGRRSIRDGSEYNKFFDFSLVQNTEVELLPDGTVYDTLKQMQKIVRTTLPQTKRIGEKLKGATREATCRNLFDFLYNYVQYKKDSPLKEQLRTPSRTWKDRKTGVDCDCYSIFISSVLTNLGIPHTFRMAGYKGDYQHVYVVVPKSGSSYTSYFTIDPVVDQFDYETPFTKKHDHMSKTTMLNGIDGCQQKPIRRFVYTDQVVEAGLVPTEQFLKANGFNFEPVERLSDGTGAFAVTTNAGGTFNVPTILTPQQAQQLLANKTKALTTSAQSAEAAIVTPVEPSPECPCKNKNKFWWGWLAIGVGAVVLFSGSDQDQVKTGLTGPPTPKKKKAKPSKLSTIHI